MKRHEGRSGGKTKHSPELNTLVSISPAHFLATGLTQARSLLTKVHRKLSNIFSLGMFLPCSESEG